MKHGVLMNRGKQVVFATMMAFAMCLAPVYTHAVKAQDGGQSSQVRTTKPAVKPNSVISIEINNPDANYWDVASTTSQSVQRFTCKPGLCKQPEEVSLFAWAYKNKKPADTEAIKNMLQKRADVAATNLQKADPNGTRGLSYRLISLSNDPIRGYPAVREDAEKTHFKVSSYGTNIQLYAGGFMLQVNSTAATHERAAQNALAFINALNLENVKEQTATSITLPSVSSSEITATTRP